VILWFDCETYSETPIKNGTYVYAENAEIMLVTYAIDDGPVREIDFTAPEMPGIDGYVEVDELLNRADAIIAHNAMFDRTVLRLNRVFRVETELEKWRCCMVKALAHGLPGGLDKVCEIMQVDTGLAKHKGGKDLIHLFCKPRPKNAKLRRATRETHPDEWQRFIEYAKADITAMRAAWKKLPSWNYGEDGIGRREVDLWHYDQRINDRGMLIDLDLAHAAIEATNHAQAGLRDDIFEATDGAVTSATKRDKLLAYLLLEHGIYLDDLKGATVTRMIEDDSLEPEIRHLLRIREQATMTSTSKYKAVVKATSRDGRLRGTLQFDGASRTRRDAGRTFQPQNLPSRGLMDSAAIPYVIDILKGRKNVDLIDDVMLAATSAIRGLIIPSPGMKLVVPDLSNIEGRGLAFLAGESWKLQAFRDFDNGIGPDLYKLAYAKSFGISPDEVDKFQRSIGKVQELALGYQGGVGAFVTFADAYNIDLDAMAEEAWPNLPNETIAEAEDFLEWMTKQKKGTMGLSTRAFLTCEVFKRLWRAAHPETVGLWKDLEENGKRAIENPGRTFEFRGFKTRRDGAWWRIRLPSGRFLCYPSPQVDDAGKISYMGVNQYNRKWCRIHTYGGKIAENATQSFSRDVMFDNIPDIEAAGYRIITRVHDELPAEAPDEPQYNSDRMSALLAQTRDYTNGMPLAAAGFEAYRYRKD
jgi:DNA polymerase